MKIEVDLANDPPDYWMYTDLGNAVVHAVVINAKANRLTWAQTYRALCKLSEQEEFVEATDTAVRECVYTALGIDPLDQNFYDV